MNNINGKYKYKVETHLHTSQSSPCSVNTGAELARTCKLEGCCAIVTTDHFDRGYGIFNKNCSWDEKISLFMKGYEDAKKEGSKIGLDVYFGFEYGCDWGSHFLVYNFGEEQLRAYPEIFGDGIEKSFRKIRTAGGFIIHAHPFRAAFTPKPGRIFPELIDAVEIINTGHGTVEENQRALEYAEKYNLVKFGGSDTHGVNHRGGGMMFARKPNSLDDIIDMAKKGECAILGE